MTTSKFREFQEDPCLEEDEFEVSGEECKKCTPNPNAFVPDWTKQDLGVPFKNEQTCQYCVVLTIDADGGFVNALNLQQRLEENSLGIGLREDVQNEQTVMVQLGNEMSYDEEALRIFLETYGKVPPKVYTDEAVERAKENIELREKQKKRDKRREKRRKKREKRFENRSEIIQKSRDRRDNVRDSIRELGDNARDTVDGFREWLATEEESNPGFPDPMAPPEDPLSTTPLPPSGAGSNMQTSPDSPLSGDDPSFDPLTAEERIERRRRNREQRQNRRDFTRDLVRDSVDAKRQDRLQDREDRISERQSDRDAKREENRQERENNRRLREERRDRRDRARDYNDGIFNPLVEPADTVFTQEYLELISSVGCEEALLTTSQTISAGTPFKFLVCIPAETLDSLEDVSPEPDLQTFNAASSVTLNGRKLWSQLVRLSFTLSTFVRYSNRSKEFQILVGDTKERFTSDLYGDRGAFDVINVYNELRDFLRDNDYSLGFGKAFTQDLADEIRIVFDNSDPAKPFVIDKVFAKKKFCDFQELTKSLGSLNTGILVNQTVMSYVSRLPEIDEKLRSPTPTPWIDFLVDYTFPQLQLVSSDGEAINSLEDGPVAAFFQDSLDKRFNLVTTAMSNMVSGVFEEWSKRNCAMTRDLLTDPEFDDELFNYKELDERFNQYINSDDSYLSIINKIKDNQKTTGDGESVGVKILKAIGICGINKLADKAIRCLLRGLSLNQFLKLQAKAYLNKLEPNAVLALSATLPPSVAQKIVQGFTEDLTTAPLPWETQYSTEGRSFTRDQIKQFYDLKERVEYVEGLSEKVEAGKKYADDYEEIQEIIRETNDKYQALIFEREEQYRKDLEKNKQSYMNYLRDEAESRGDDPNAVVFNQEEFDSIEFLVGNTLENTHTAYENDVQELEGERDELNRPIQEQADKIYSDNKLGSYYSALKAIEEGPFDESEWEQLGYDTKQQFLRDVERFKLLETRGKSVAKRDLERRSYDQASLYRPLPNLQAALTEAYTEQLLNFIGVEDLQRIIDNIPDVVPIGPAADALKCPWQTLFEPPVKRFLGTAELQKAFNCNENQRATWPKIPKINAVNLKDAITKNLSEALLKTVSDTTLKLLLGLLDLAMTTLDEAVCKTLGGLGDNFINGLNGGGEDGFFDVMADAFAANPDLPQNKRDLKNGVMDKVLDGYGIRPNDCPELNEAEISENYRSLYRAIGYSLSVREMKELFSYRIEEYNPLVLTRVQQSIVTHAECFKDTFNNPQSVGKLFRDISSSVPLDKKNEIRQSIEEADALIPVFTSICLNQQQYDKWLQDRIDILVRLGIPEDIARENVEGEDNNNAETLEKLLNANKDLDDFIADNIANDLSINDGPQFDNDGNLIDPSCYKKDGLLDTNSDDISESVDVVNNAYFDTLEISLVKDLTVGGIFGDGLMNRILANTDDDGFTAHNWKSNTIVFKRKRFVGYEDTDSEDVPDDADIFYPKTVGSRYYTETVEESTFDATIPQRSQPAPVEIDRSTVTDLLLRRNETEEPQVTSPSFSLQFEQLWDDNFKTEKSKRLERRTSVTDLYLLTSGSSPFTYRITNKKLSVINKTSEDKVTADADPETDLIITQTLDPSLTMYLNRNFNLMLPQSHPLRSQVFNKYLQDSFKNIDIILKSDADDSFYSTAYGKTVELVYNEVKNMCYNDPEGQMNSGFSFGYDPESELTEEDLNYVDPEPGSTSYTKRRSDKVLGRSQTDHPRVFFLDPEKHGGSYLRPRIYIEPPRNFGWLAIYDALVPEVDGCEPARQVIINTREIKQYVSETKNKISRDPRLNNPSDCIQEIPFDVVMSQQSRAQIEGAIIALLRVYGSESYIYTSPIFSSIFAGFDGNYDDSLFELLANDIIEDMEGREGILRRAIRNKTYVNTFLEQCVQMYARKYYSGELEPSEEAMEALTKIEESQIRYKYPSDLWLKDFFDVTDTIKHTYPHRAPTIDDMPYPTFYDVPAEVVERLFPLADQSRVSYIGVIAPGQPFAAEQASFEQKQQAVQELLIRNFYINSLLYQEEGERMFVPANPENLPIPLRAMIDENGNLTVPVEKPPGPLKAFVKRANKFFRFYTRMYTVRTMRPECTIIFKELLKEQFKYIVNSMANAVDKKADFFRVSQHFSTRGNIFYGNDTNYGTLQSVLESEVRGDIASVHNTMFDNFFDQIDLSEDQLENIKNKGCFVIQKYYRLTEKESEEQTNVQDVLSSRDKNLYGVVNPESFLEYLNLPLPEDSEFSFDEELLISDAFGDLQIVYGLEGQELRDGVVVDSETGEEAPPIPEDTPEENLIELGITGTSGIKKGLRLLYVPNEEHYDKLMLDNPALKIIEEDISLDEYLNELQSPEADVPAYLTEKAYITRPYVSEESGTCNSLGVMIPLASVEIEELDKQLTSLENFTADDYKCLLTKLVETDEYKMLFEYCFPVNIFIGHNLVHTNKSFYMSLGQGEGERLETDAGLSLSPNPPRTPRFRQPDDEILASLDDTKDNLRRIFASIYTSEDFRGTFQFDGDMDKMGLLNFAGLLLPSLRFIGGHRKARRPFNKDGGECESPVGKLFGGR